MSAPATPEVESPPETDPVQPRSVGPFIAIGVALVVIAGALCVLLVGREPVIETTDFATAFACPPGVESRTDRMQVTASKLNVRTAPDANADPLPDRTLRRNVAVTEECRGDSWSRVRLVDGRSGWVANRYLAPVSQRN